MRQLCVGDAGRLQEMRAYFLAYREYSPVKNFSDAVRERGGVGRERRSRAYGDYGGLEKVIYAYLQPFVFYRTIVSIVTRVLLVFLEFSIQRCLADIKNGGSGSYIAICLEYCFVDSNTF